MGSAVVEPLLKQGDLSGRTLDGVRRCGKLAALILAEYVNGNVAAELEAFHQEVIDKLKVTFSVFMSSDVEMARHLIAENAKLRAAEIAAAESHLTRLREGRPESIESSSLHLDILRDRKRIHSHICSAAYPVLERADELQTTRLKEVVADSAAWNGQWP